MKLVLGLLIIIVTGLLAYVGYGLISYEPKKPAALVFDDVIDPTMLATTPVTLQDLPLTPEQQKQSEESVEKISAAVIALKATEDQAPPAIKPTLEILRASIIAARLPAFLLSARMTNEGVRSYESLNFDLTSQQSAETLNTNNIVCELNAGLVSNVLLGNNAENRLSCNTNDGNIRRDQIFIGGAGNDVISDSFGNRIVNGGAGNDSINLGKGRSIIVLEEGWGQDSVTLDCTNSRIEEEQIPEGPPTGFPIPWTAQFQNFIVLTPKVAQTDLEWNENTLTRKGSNDRLTVNEKCFTVITLN